MRVLVTGASGFVGRHLVAALRDGGHDVTVLRRGGSGDDPAVFHGPADLAEIDRWPRWPERIDAVAHLAALNPSRGDPALRDTAALTRANAQASAALARRAVREGVRRIVLVGSANVHLPPPDGAPVRESDRLDPHTPYAVSKARAEAAFHDALRGSQTQGCVLRPAPVFGPGGRGTIAVLARLARHPLPLPLVGLAGARSLVCVDSLVSAIVLALDRPGAAGETFLVADDDPLTPADIVSTLRRGWRRRPALFPAPRAALALVARSAGKAEAWHRLALPFVLDTAHIQSTLGWRPQNARESLRAMAAAGRI